MVGGEIATETTASVLAGDPELQRRYLGVEPLHLAESYARTSRSRSRPRSPALLVAGCGGSGKRARPASLFVSVKDGDYAIFGANADGRHARRLTKEKGDPSSPTGLFFQVQPAWSPDAKKIAFASGRSGAPPSSR